MNNKTALILGATGLIGGHLLQLLCADERWQTIRVVGRRRPQYTHAKIDFVQTELLDIEQLPAEHFKVDALFNCLGTTLKKAGSREAFKAVDLDAVLAAAWRARQQEVPLMLSVSAYGAAADSRVFYSRVKGLVERQLENLGFRQLVLLQPSLLLGERQEFRLGEALADKGWHLFEPVLGKLTAPWVPVQAQAVAKAMQLAAVESFDRPVVRLRYRDIQQRQ